MKRKFILIVFINIILLSTIINQVRADDINIYGNYGENINSFLESLSSDSKYIYFKNFSDGGKLYRSNFDGSEKIKLSNDNVKSINVLNGWVYYIAIGSNGSGGKIKKVKIDGTGLKTVVNTVAERFVIADDWIYYSSVNDKGYLLKIRIDGLKKTALYKKDLVLDFYFYGNCIYFNHYRTEKRGDQTEYIAEALKMKTDGSGLSLVRDENTDLESVNSSGIYFTNRSEGYPIKLYKMSFGKSEPEIIDINYGEPNIIIDDNGDIYYFDALDLCKYSNADKTSEILYTRQSSSFTDLFIAKDWIYYTGYVSDNNDDSAVSHNENDIKIFGVNKNGDIEVQIN